MSGLRRTEDGAALVELAVALPVLLLLAIGAAEFGRVYHTAVTVANAARAGAHYGSQRTTFAVDAPGMEQASRNEAADIGTIRTKASYFCRCSNGTIPVCTASCSGYGVPQVFVKDSVEKIFPLILRYPGIPDSFTVRHVAVFRVQ
ncbi:MAG: TadE/TadG family type IV pilus assembly protein [Gemmatimonadales bacterium]